MKIRKSLPRLSTLALLGILLIGTPHAAAAQADTTLTGVWEAKRRFGPDVRGPLLVEQLPGGWRAQIAGETVQPRIADSTLAFELPGGRGAFRGRFASGDRIRGQWIQPRMVTSGVQYASPVELVRDGTLWRGEVVPLDDEFTFYLVVRPRADGTVGALLRNPERNLGRQLRVNGIDRSGDSVRLLGTRGSPPEVQVVGSGTLREDGILSLYIPGRGGGYDFRRMAPDEVSGFYPRGRPDAGYAYQPPPALRDGWPTGTLEDAGISRAGIEAWMRSIIHAPDDSVTTPRVHGVVIARRGRLVLEEYFHGESRERPHDTRSASKVLVSTLAGAVIQAGTPLRLTSPVYEVMNGGAFPPGLEPRKRAMTLENLLTMASGLDCDDSNPDSRGNEETLTNQEDEPDYYRYTLALSMVRDPGQQADYCSASPNLAGGVVSRAAGEPLPELMQALIGGPLEMGRYYLPLTPTGDGYGGGGMRFTLRDFARIGEMYRREGRWNERQVLSSEWVGRATSPLFAMGDLRYGFFWYVLEYPHRGRTVKAYFAGGNGGQTLMVIPELEMVIAIFAGNYADYARTIGMQRTVVPRDILPSVGDLP